MPKTHFLMQASSKCMAEQVHLDCLNVSSVSGYVVCCREICEKNNFCVLMNL